MKRSFMTIFFLALIFCSQAQSLFFDSLNGSTWTTAKFYNDSALRTLKEISLIKLKDTYESHLDREIWAFSDVLTIRHYSAKTRCVMDMSTYKYVAVSEKGILKIFLTGKSSVKYRVGITSTGNSALLTRIEE